MPKTIYLVGSLRNPRVPQVANELRACGFNVFDDWYGAGDEADDKWQQYENGRQRSYRDALAGEAAQHIFHFDLKLINKSDAVILVLPAGKSGHLEFGYARGIGKAAVILLDGEPERFDVMYNFAHMVTSNLPEAAAYIFNWMPAKTNGSAQVIDGLQAELSAHKVAYQEAVKAISSISYCSAQSGRDALAMRDIATTFIRTKGIQT